MIRIWKSKRLHVNYLRGSEFDVNLDNKRNSPIFAPYWFCSPSFCIISLRPRYRWSSLVFLVTFDLRTCEPGEHRPQLSAKYWAGVLKVQLSPSHCGTVVNSQYGILSTEEKGQREEGLLLKVLLSCSQLFRSFLLEIISSTSHMPLRLPKSPISFLLHLEGAKKLRRRDICNPSTVLLSIHL